MTPGSARRGRAGLLAGAAEKVLPPIVLTLATLAIWEFVAPLLVPDYILPRLSTVVADIAAGWESLAFHLWVTASETLIGLGLSIAVALPLAFAMVNWTRLEAAAYPLVVATQAIPKVAIAPLIVVWFGFGIGSKALVAFLVAFFPLLIDTITGLKSVNPDLIRLARTMQASKWGIYRWIMFPAALPHIFSGVKTAATLAVVGAVVGEFMGSNEGLGYILLVAQGRIETPRIFSGILLLSLLGIGLFYAVQLAERLVIPWHESQRRDGGS